MAAGNVSLSLCTDSETSQTLVPGQTKICQHAGFQACSIVILQSIAIQLRTSNDMIQYGLK